MDLSNSKFEWVALSAVDFNDKRFQCRVSLDETEIQGLIASLKDKGQLNPVYLMRLNSGNLIIVCGFTRYEAIKRLGWDKCLAVTIGESQMSQKEAYDFSVIDNVQRRTLNDTDLMHNCLKYNKEGMSVSDIARMIGKSRGSVENYIKVASAPQAVQDAIKSGKISVKKALTLMKSGVVPAAGRGGSGTDKAQTQNKTTATDALTEAVKSENSSEALNKLYEQAQGMAAELSQIPGLGEQIKKAMEQARCTPEDPASEERQVVKDPASEEQSGKDAGSGVAGSGASEWVTVAGGKTGDMIGGQQLIPLKRMYVKPVVGGGFDLVLKFRPSVDSIDKAIEFLRKNIEKLEQLKN